MAVPYRYISIFLIIQYFLRYYDADAAAAVSSAYNFSTLAIDSPKQKQQPEEIPVDKNMRRCQNLLSWSSKATNPNPQPKAMFTTLSYSV
jgi:hypothetical protein